MKKSIILKYFLSVFVVGLFVIIPLVSQAAFWTERMPEGAGVDRNWVSGASDADGSNLIVGQSSGRIYTSSNGGTSWTERQPVGGVNRTWRSVASDADGSNLIVSETTNGTLHTSSNGGANWTERQPAGAVTKAWQAVASDDDGSNLIAGVSNGRLYTSDDSGASWTERQPAGDIDAAWLSVASGADGTDLFAVVSGGRAYFSDDSGANWSEVQPAGDVDVSWIDVAMDADGSNLIAVAAPGRLYTSSNSGAGWTERQPAGDVDEQWQTVASDDDGSHLIAGVAGGRLYTSSDGGANWTEELPAGATDKNWQAVASDADGSHLLVAATVGRVFTSPDNVAPTVASFDPADNSTTALIDGTFDIVFNEDIATSTGNIELHLASDDSLVESIDVAGAQVTTLGTTGITIDPTTVLDPATDYYFLIDAGAVEDLSGNAFAGIASATTWNFTTDTPPSVTGLTPVDDAVDVAVDFGGDGIILVFDQFVTAGTGNITLHKTSDDSVVETFDITNGSVVFIGGSEFVTVLPEVILDNSTEYYVLVDDGAIQNETGSSFVGISDPTAWSFTTEAAIPLATLDFERVNVSDADDEADGPTETPAVSSDGRYVAFGSEATNLVADDTNGQEDIFVYDRTLDTIERVSVADGNVESDSSSYSPTISSDGRYVAFTSEATNLVADDINDAGDIFVYDRTLDTIERVSVADGAVESDNSSDYPSISADGRYVAFSSYASNLVDDDTNGQEDVFVYDRTLDTIERVSVADGNVESDGGSRYVSISGDGRYVAFQSGASDLVAGDVNDASDVFVYDRTLDTIERVSVDGEGNGGDAESYLSGSTHVLSDDGRFVTFWSTATNLVADDTNNFQDVFVYDRTLNTVERIGDSVEYSQNPSISDDGRYVVFRRSTDSGGGSYFGIYRYDRDEDTLLFVTEGALVDGNETSNPNSPVLSEDGLTVAFVSDANNLVAGDTNAQRDVFVYEESVVTPGDDDDSGDDDDDSTNNSGHRRGGGGGSSGNDAVIKSLLSRIQELKAILAGLLGTSQDGGSSPSTCSFTRDLTLNDIGTDVRCLQDFLIKQNKGPAAQALAANGSTGFFGGLTQAALAEYQASVGIMPAAGYFGPLTRASMGI